ncbi:MAG: protein serine/threonine phosphatase, partial [Bacteroidetes bacterium]|nr:protein serine/threonine phosphatase [Bacteroidota bacterium]
MKRRGTYFLLSCVFTCLIASGIFSQNRSADSLKSVVNKNNEDTNEVKACAELCKLYYNSGEYAEAVSFGQKGIALAEKLNYPQGLAKCFRYMGSVYFLQSDLHKAQIYYSKALKI